jgi:hypothetical protein
MAPRSTALTNLDVHDIARPRPTACRYYIVTPVSSQRDATSRGCAGRSGEGTPGGGAGPGPTGRRDHDAIEDLVARHGRAPVAIATSASDASFAAVPRGAPAELVAAAPTSQDPVLILFGTGWGLDDRQIPAVSRVLAPIRGRRRGTTSRSDRRSRSCWTGCSGAARPKRRRSRTLALTGGPDLWQKPPSTFGFSEAVMSASRILASIEKGFAVGRRFRLPAR